MSLYFNAAAQQLVRATYLPSPVNFTMCAWVYRVANNDGVNNRTIFYLVDNPVTTAHNLFFDDTTEDLLYAGAGAAVTVLAATVQASWYFVALSCSGTGGTAAAMHYRTASQVALTSATTTGVTFTQAGMYLGNDSFSEALMGRMAAFKLWDGILTAAELMLESTSFRAVRRLNLNTELPLFTNQNPWLDRSLNRYNFSLEGAPLSADDPQIIRPVPRKHVYLVGR